jgi:ATP-dependent exoDNAse (exonuclease V) beta subunit
MDKIGQWQRAGAVHVGQIVELLDAVDSGRDFDQTAPTLDDNAVKIMTLHGAKGLEFKTVILAGLETTNNKSPSVLWGSAGDGTFYPEFGLGELGHRKISSDIRLELAAQDKEADRDEERRLLYVALTRAIETVVVVAPATRPKKLATMGATIEPLLDENGVQDFLPWPATKGNSGQSAPIRIAPDREIIQELIAHHAKLRSTTATQLRAFRDDDQPVSYAAAKHDDEVPTGTGYGTIVHAILATASTADSRDRLMQLARIAESDSGVILSEQWRDAAVDSVQLAFKQSDVLRGALNAAESWRELPFTVAINDVIVDGVIDLLHLNDDGRAVIVDFKTDIALDDVALAMYQRQLAIYVLGIKTALGIAIADTVLVQVRPDHVTDHRLGPLTELQEVVVQQIS